MRRFRSTLQAVLTLRQRQEHLAMERYSHVLLARQRATETLALADRERVQAAAALGTRLKAGMPAAHAVMEQAHYRSLETRRQGAQQALVVAENAVAPALKGMLDARRKREVVEKCIERQRERHAHDEEVQERKMLDELASRRMPLVRSWAGNN